MSSIRDFIPLSKIGEGTYSTVYKVQRRSDGKVYALKKVKMNQLNKKEQENALNEIRILASIESPAIISYKDAFFDENINVLCIVMEYAGTHEDSQTKATCITSSPNTKSTELPSLNIRSGPLLKTCF
jgi:serine/threonine protein kinase